MISDVWVGLSQSILVHVLPGKICNAAFPFINGGAWLHGEYPNTYYDIPANNIAATDDDMVVWPTQHGHRDRGVEMDPKQTFCSIRCSDSLDLFWLYRNICFCNFGVRHVAAPFFSRKTTCLCLLDYIVIFSCIYCIFVRMPHLYICIYTECTRYTYKCVGIH